MESKKRSNDFELVKNNFKLIINSNSYNLAHEDLELLNSDEMRGVRMLLEISKPEQILEQENILSTIIVFGGAKITDKVSVKQKIEQARYLLKENPSSIQLKREKDRLDKLYSMSHYYDSAREFSRIISLKIK